MITFSSHYYFSLLLLQMLINTSTFVKLARHRQTGEENCQTRQLANPAWCPQPTIATTDIQEAAVAGLATSWHQKSMETGTLRCLQKEMVTCRHWSVSLWRDPDNVSHCRILSSDRAEWRLIPAALYRWRRCFLADQFWFMIHIREEEDWFCVSQQLLSASVSRNMSGLLKKIHPVGSLLFLVCISWAIIGQPRNSVFIRRV